MNHPFAAQANTGAKHTGGSQFFMNVADNRNLDWFSPGASKHPVFGCLDKASLGLAVKISQVPTRDDNPRNPVKMVKVKVVFPGAGEKRKSEGDDASPAKKRAL